jgi:hypothetical protein
VQYFKERRAAAFQLLFEPLGAIAIAASPGVSASLITALAPIMSVLYFREIEILSQ